MYLQMSKDPSSSGVREEVSGCLIKEERFDVPLSSALGCPWGRPAPSCPVMFTGEGHQEVSKGQLSRVLNINPWMKKGCYGK